MKILDRYIAKNFLIGYVISFGVLIGLRVLVDLFVNLDEFAESAEDVGAWGVMANIVTFYGMNLTVYFRDIAGVITVVAAAFSLGRMVRNNELVAMIASGVSAKRIVGPILLLAIFFTGLSVVDQELLIPSISDYLVRDEDDIAGQKAYGVWFLVDGKGSLLCSPKFDIATATLLHPTIITRRETKDMLGVWEVTGRISADSATYNPQTGNWDLVNGRYVSTDPNESARAVAVYTAPDLLPKDIDLRRNVGFDSLLSSRQLAALAAQKTKVRDMAQLLSQKHFRITDPIINLTMLMVSLPVLICRDPRTMKSAILVSFVLTASCFVTSFVCKMLATEVVLGNRVMPEFWAWLPVLIFLPIAIIELDSMKT
ncbi:MAG TPA: LptF/LptG family permease [Sedimentisphaerales bacterium]|jgi:lipopolysaccharide export LptBFGC system permease protein LptF|nr:LptF/LptG family permease [Sedimentisphaerales bacterium]HNU27642.1 LptF/LptG family permease [Sedimentisphaerales bacterium]